MVNTTMGSRLVGMAGQTVGRIGACVDGVDNLCPGAVMTGRTVA